MGCGEAADLSRDVLRLILLIICLADLHRYAAEVVGPERFFPASTVAAYDVHRHIQNGLRGSVVLLEQQDGRVGIIALEVQDVGDIGGTP